MRQRKRAQWPLSVYQYWVRLPSPSWAQLPVAVQQETESMRTLWNQLVETFERRQTAYREILAQFPQTTDPQDGAKVLQPVLQKLRQSFFAETRRLTTTCSATWANKEFILRQFLTATDRFFNKQSGPPRRKTGTPQEVHFHHRFTSGGVPVESIFGRGQRLHLEPLPSEVFSSAFSQRQRKRLVRTTGTFQVRDTPLSFATILHRPLPKEAYLKTAALIGKQVVREGYRQHRNGGHLIAARWNWSLQLTLEIPPHQVVAREHARPMAALALSARARDDGWVQIGVVTDTTGREESLVLPDRILTAWQHKRALQRKADQFLEHTKRQLRQLPYPTPCSAAARSLFDHLGTARAPRMWRLLWFLEEAQAKGEAMNVLRCWADRSTKLLREARGLERRYLGHRDWFYHNLTLQLCRRYRRIAVAATDCQEGATNKPQEQEPSLQEAATYRHFTAMSRFLLFLRQAAAKTDTEIVTGPPSCPVEATSDKDTLPDPVQRG